MEIFEYPSHSLAHLTYTGKQDSKRPWRNVRRVTEEYILYFVIEGEIFLEEDGTPYHLTPGDFFLLEPGKLHFGTQYSRCVFYYVHFRHLKYLVVSGKSHTFASQFRREFNKHFGALVQLVRIRACHARGQGFESPTHRKP